MGIALVMFSYCDFDVNHLVVVFKWYLRTLCVCLDNVQRLVLFLLFS